MLGDCTTVRMRVGAAEVVEKVVTEDMDVEMVGKDEDEDDDEDEDEDEDKGEDENEDEDEEVKFQVLEEIKEPKEAVNCSGDAASKVSLVGYEQFSLPDP